MFIVEEGEGLSNSNQYASYNEILAYAMSRYGYEWFYKSDDCVFQRPEVNRAIVSASDKIDSIRWGGCRTKKNQAMEFPRTGLLNKCEGYCAPCRAIPAEIKESVIVMTLAILKGDVQVNTNESHAKVKSMSFDKQSIEFATGAYVSGGAGCGGGMQTVSGDDFHQVRHLIDCFERKGNSANIKFVRNI